MIGNYYDYLEECSGYVYECNCEDCKHILELFKEYDFLEQDKEENSKRLREIEIEVSKNGYSM